MNLTPRQSATLEFIEESFHANHRIPPYRDVAKGLGISPTAAALHIRALCEKGVIEKCSPRSYRFNPALYAIMFVRKADSAVASPVASPKRAES